MGKKARVFLTVLAVLLASAAFFGYHFHRQWVSYQALVAEKTALSVKLDAANEETEALQQELENSQTNSFVERMAREILGWVKPGEIKIVDKNK